MDETEKIDSEVNQNLRPYRPFTISELAENDPHLDTIVYNRYYHEKPRVQGVPKILTEQQKEQRTSSGRAFLKRCRQDVDLFFQIVVTDVLDFRQSNYSH